jgi:hypothetical protein
VLQSLLSFIPILKQPCNTIFSPNFRFEWVEIDTFKGGKHFLLKNLDLVKVLNSALGEDKHIIKIQLYIL